MLTHEKLDNLSIQTFMQDIEIFRDLFWQVNYKNQLRHDSALPSQLRHDSALPSCLNEVQKPLLRQKKYLVCFNF